MNGSQVVPDLRLLLAALLEQPLGDHELHVRSGDEELIEAILDAAQTICDRGESVAVEDRFLHAGHEAEAEILAHLAHLAQEVQIEDQH